MTTPYPQQRPESLGFIRPRLRGDSRFARRLERVLPRFVVRHTLLLAWLWIAVWAALALTEELTGIPEGLFSLATALMVLPPLISTGLCLWATPRYQLLQTESILTHFMGRFLTVIFAFIAWTVSIVIGASISSLIQLLGENKESEVIGTGFQLMAAITPVVAILIWLGLIMRCSWILLRLRGWRAYPITAELPDTFLSETPSLRRFTISLAHPGLLATAGLLSAIGAVLMALGNAALNLSV